MGVGPRLCARPATIGAWPQRGWCGLGAAFAWLFPSGKPLETFSGYQHAPCPLRIINHGHDVAHRLTLRLVSARARPEWQACRVHLGASESRREVTQGPGKSQPPRRRAGQRPNRSLQAFRTAQRNGRRTLYGICKCRPRWICSLRAAAGAGMSTWSRRFHIIIPQYRSLHVEIHSHRCAVHTYSVHTVYST